MKERLLCPKCRKQLTPKDMGYKCSCGTWQYYSLASKTLTKKEEIIKNVIMRWAINLGIYEKASLVNIPDTLDLENALTNALKTTHNTAYENLREKK